MELDDYERNRKFNERQARGEGGTRRRPDEKVGWDCLTVLGVPVLGIAAIVTALVTLF